MLKQLTRRPWICPACLSHSRRSLVGLATAEAPPRTTPSRTDDGTLRRIFDSDPLWRDFSRKRPSLDGKITGLLHNKYLSSPQGYMEFAGHALEKCRSLVHKLTTAATTQEYISFARDFDRLSDQLCRVIDSVEFIRNVHPDPRIQQAATQAHGAMYEYMNVLNTHKELYDQLKKASTMPEVVRSWSEEEMSTTNILLKDFSQSAIGEPEPVRKKFVSLSNDIIQAGSEMLDKMTPQTDSIRFPSSQLKGIDPRVVQKFTKWGTTTLPTGGRYSSLALKTAMDPEARREIYRTSRASSSDSVARVEHLLKKRSELAQLCGHESFAHMTLSDKMAKTPQAVGQFLSALAADNKVHVDADLRELVELKKGDANTSNSPDVINAWDRQYYTSRLRSLLYARNRPNDILSAYFSLGTVMQGLSRLFTRLYGVSLQPRETPPGETWNDDIRRLDVIDEREGHIAVLYCDLFARPNKTPNPAHFTLRCSREITQAEISEAQEAHLLPANPTLSELSLALNDGMALSVSPTTGRLHQLPTIAFICDFPRPKPTSSQPTLLTYSQVLTLFHEMGHALHSILGRTSLQNVSGTRCATDFAELPSILMEYFASSPSVLQLFARHWATDEPLNVDLVSQELRENQRLLAAQETEAQILFSVLDQRYHAPDISALAAQGPGWSTGVYHDVYSDPEFASVPEPRGTSWQGFFGHLFGYGAVYYSYLFDRAIAGRVWSDVFSESPLDRGAGERYRDEVLRWGGGRDPWRCVGGVLGERYEWMGVGGEEAMREVGRWGVGEAGSAGTPS